MKLKKTRNSILTKSITHIKLEIRKKSTYQKVKQKKNNSLTIVHYAIIVIIQKIRIKKRKYGILSKFTDMQSKKEKSSAQREASDIQSTQVSCCANK
jgi:hypothetical protein